MRRARGHSTTHWFAVIAALSLSGLIATPARPGALAPQQSSSSSSSTTSSAPAHSTSKKKSKKRHARREPSQKAPTPERISEIQSALARNGYYQGQPTGKWDANTISAMQKFQSDNGIEPNGKLNAPSLQKLGLGSSTAGVSAPKPPAPTPPSAAPASTTPASAPASAPSAPAPAASSAASASANASGATSASAAAAPDPKPASSAPKPPQP